MLQVMPVKEQDGQQTPAEDSLATKERATT